MNDYKLKTILNKKKIIKKKNFAGLSIFSLPVVFALLFMLFSCEREDMYSFAQHKLAIGDIGPGGGVVFYVSDGGLHGLEAAPIGWNGVAADPQSTWSTITTTAVGSAAQGAAIGTGSSNTYAIILQNSGAASAAKMCKDYTGGDKHDWFLPSADELNAIYVNLVNAGYPSGVGGYSGNTYWTSSEDPANASDYAFQQNFTSGTSGISVKASNIYIRPVRAF